MKTVLLAASVAWAVAQCAHAASLSGSRPNIVFILTDDQGYGDLSCHGNPVLETPNIDRLHREGVRFTDFHVSPTCAPTRSALLTGRHEFKNGVTHTILERERLTLKATTLAQVLHAAGYTTGIFGKWHLGDEPKYRPAGADSTRCSSTAQEASDRPTPARAAMRPATPISIPPFCTTAAS